MKALNAGNSERNFARLLATEEGGRTAYERVELAQRFTDKAWIAQLAPGTVGADYREFLEPTGYSADGLAEVPTTIRSAERRVGQACVCKVSFWWFAYTYKK